MNKKPTIFVTKVDLAIGNKLLTDLKSKGFEISQPQYTVFSAKKKGLSCTLYQSGKLMVQGKETPDFMEFYLEPEILQSFEYSHKSANVDMSPHIGIDESGKGDIFGALCIAGVYADRAGIEALQKIGVRDSKGITDSNIMIMAGKIKKVCAYHVIKLKPSKYNELYDKFRNLNSLLGWGHAATIESLVEKTGCRTAIIDQFAAEHVVLNALKRKNLTLDLTQRTKGEEDIVVAAASILARQAFLESISDLSREFAIKLPKGANSKVVTIGRHFVTKHGEENLRHVAKLHFKTLDAIRQ